MSLADSIGNGLLVAAGKISTAGAILSRTGSFVAARTGAGAYTITLPSPGVPAGANWMIGCCHTAGVTQISIVDTSDTVKTVATAVVAVATDSIFSFEIWQILPNS